MAPSIWSGQSALITSLTYTREDFTKGAQHYDLIPHKVGTHSLLEYKRVLNPKGIFVMIGSTTPGNWFGFLATPIKGLMLSPFVSQKFGMILAELNKNDLATLGTLMQSGKVTPVIDRRYKLSETPEALRYLEEGHARGKVVLTVE
jgi:NADPH:quinone reductase-like Zn-dependent oxidoreductase